MARGIFGFGKWPPGSSPSSHSRLEFVRMRFAHRLFIFLLAAAIHSPAQVVTGVMGGVQPLPNDNARYTLSGTVVNSVTGEPIRRALVSVFYQQQVSIMTDTNGHFEFEGLPRTMTTVTAQKPGYFSDQELSAGRRRPTLVSVGPDAPAAIIKLVPEAIITGRIVDTDGLPVRALLVRTLAQKMVNGRREWQQGTLDRTDADGVYRISNLMPGTYFLIAGPGRAQAFVSGQDDNSDLGYPAVTYPGPDAPFRINAGQQLEANFTVRPEPFYSITGSVAGVTPGNRYFLQLVPRTPGVRTPVGGAAADPDSGTFTMLRIAHGDYILQARGNSTPKSGETPEQFFGSIPVSVRGNVMGITVPVEPSLTIPVRVRSERTREPQSVTGLPNAPRVQIRLEPTDQDRPPAFSMPENPKEPGSPLIIRNAVPGRYRIEVLPTFGDSYVASARFGTTDLLDGELTLARSANQGVIDVVIRDDGARLSVKVQGEQASRGVSVLLLPDRGEPKVTEMVGSSSDAIAQFHALRPGTYTVFAFEDLSDIEYTNRAALEPYSGRGVKISLAPGQQTTVNAEVIRRGAE